MSALAHDMMEAPQPLSCRRAAEALGTSRYTIWRWRMAVIGALAPKLDNTLSGIVEADEAHQRESRKGEAGQGSLQWSDTPPNREWVWHRRKSYAGIWVMA